MDNLNVFITGASSGIGRSLALDLSKNGTTLGLLARGQSGDLKEVAESCRKLGATVYEYLVDVTNPEEVEKSANHFISSVNRVDWVIANAGVAKVGEDSANNYEVPIRNIEVNYFGLIYTFCPFISAMKKQQSGHLVAISSISSLRSTHNSGAYSASKAAVNLWTEGLRLQLRDDNVAVTTLCVGFVDTAMTRGNPFWMPGLISSSKASQLIISAIKQKRRLATLPWISGSIWTIFWLLPGSVYDFIIAWAKTRQRN